MSPVALALLAETHPLERRVALVPRHLGPLLERGVEVRVVAGAGMGAGVSDEAWREAGASVLPDATRALEGAKVVVRIRPPGTGATPRAEGSTSHASSPSPSSTHSGAGSMGLPDEVSLLPRGAILVSHLSPGGAEGLEEALTARQITALALERVPRTTRAQRMDVLSSQATVAGYRAVLRAAGHLPRFLPMLTTAAGTIRPARFLVLGAGVAGLQAIATARRLGAAVTGFDVRPAAREQIRSLGARSLEPPTGNAEAAGGYARALTEEEEAQQLAFLAEHLPEFDAVITTAQIPGRPAPLLLTPDMTRSLRPGGVVVDLAAETGGNCALSRPGEIVQEGGITIDAPLALPSELPEHASEMFSRNLANLLLHLFETSGEGAGREGNAGTGAPLRIDPDDDVLGPMLVTRGPAVASPSPQTEAPSHG